MAKREPRKFRVGDVVTLDPERFTPEDLARLNSRLAPYGPVTVTKIDRDRDTGMARFQYAGMPPNEQWHYEWAYVLAPEHFPTDAGAAEYEEIMAIQEME